MARRAAELASKTLQLSNDETKARDAVENLQKKSVQEAMSVAAERAKQIANSIGGKSRVIPSPATVPSVTPKPDSKQPVSTNYFADKIEINDYPQHARWRVTHKGALDDLIDEYDISITSKGIYVPEGRKPQLGEEKLYFLIEGKTESDVAQTKAEIRRRLEEAAVSGPQDKTRYGKYSVL